MKIFTFTILFLMLPAFSMAQTVDELVDRAERAGMNPETLASLQDRADQRGLSVAETARLIEPAVLLAEQDLPSRAVVQRALEGLAKGVSSAQIEQVLGRLQQATERAGQTGDAWLNRSDVQATLNIETPEQRGQARNVIVESLAQAYTRDMPAEALEATLERIPNDVSPGRTSVSSVGAALQVLPDLPVTGQNPNMAANLVSEALQSGFNASEMRRLPAAMETAQRRGEMPVETVAQGALSGMAQGTPAATILERLFQGQIPGQPPGGAPPGLDQRPDGGQGGPPGGN